MTLGRGSPGGCQENHAGFQIIKRALARIYLKKGVQVFDGANKMDQNIMTSSCNKVMLHPVPINFNYNSSKRK